jgi:hypothetical protein
VDTSIPPTCQASLLLVEYLLEEQGEREELNKRED